MKYSKITKQRGDTIHLNLEIPSNFRYEKDRYNTQFVMDNNGCVVSEFQKVKDTHRKESFGVGKINIVPHSHIECQFSAKILGNDYREGITMDTIPEVVDILNEVGGMNITRDGILNKSTMRVFDNTYNIDLDEKDSVGEYIKSLQFGCVGNYKLGVTNYGAESMELRLSTKVKNRMIFYNKEVELRTHSKDFIKKHNIIDEFKDTLRVEYNLTTMDKMRQAFLLGSSKVRLTDILSSKENAVIKNFARFVDVKTSEKLLFDYDTLISMEVKNKPDMHEKYFLKEHFKKYKGNIDKVFLIYQTLYGDGKIPTREKTKIKTYWKVLETQNTTPQNVENYTKKFREIKEKLNSL